MNQQEGLSSEPSTGLRKVKSLPRRLFSSELIILFFLASAFFAIASFYAQYSPRLRWLLLVVLLILGGWLAGKFVYLQTAKVESLSRHEAEPGLPRGSLVDLSASLKRGIQGLRYSQLVFALSMRDAFLEKIRAETGFLGETRDLIEDSARLKTLCRDEELSRFIRRVSILERSMAQVLSSSVMIFPGEPSSFARDMDGIFQRMEAWP